MCTKLVELFANQVVERRNMINDYLRGRACIEFVRGSLIQGEFLSLSFSCSFCFGIELFLALLAILLGLPLFLSFVGFAAFPSTR
jgi:hypothetical protein